MKNLIFIGFILVLFVTLLVLIGSFLNERKIYALNEQNLNGAKKRTQEKYKKTRINAIKIEEYILKKLHLDPEDKKTIIAFRTILLIFSVVFCMNVSLSIFLFFIAEVFMIIFFEIKYSDIINNRGIDSLFNTSKFLDSYIPSISSGTSVRQSMLNFIDKIKDEKLMNWWYNKEEIPKEWEDAIRIYNNGLHSEELGFSDNATSTQKDILMKISFYNDLEKGINDSKSISYCFYFGLPIIVLISYSTNPDFWHSFGGYLDSLALIVLFFIFQFLMFDLKKKTVEKLF